MRSVRGKLLSVCSVLLLLPVLTMGSVSYFSAKNHLTESGEVMIQNSVQLALQMIETVNAQVEAGDLSLEEAQEQVKSQLIGELQSDGSRPIDSPVDLGDNGYFAVYDETGTLIAHPTIEGENIMDVTDVNGFAFVKDVFEKAYNGGGFTEYAWPLPTDPEKVEDKIMYSAFDPNWGWIISTGSYYLDFNKGANEILTVIAVTTFVSLFAGAILVYFLSKNLSRPILQVQGQLQEISNNNLSFEDIHIGNRDEIGQLAGSLNKMKNNLSEMISRISSVSHTLAASSEELSASADETNRATEQIAASIQTISENANEQSEQAGSSKDLVKSISGKINEIHDYTEAVERAASLSAQKVTEGKNHVKETSEKMSIIQDKTRNAAIAVNQLGNKSQEIGNILDLITAVAEQTNLLSLNAAIEAARAGEHGKGFAVVADEIRKLAEQSSKSALQIHDLITDIRQGIEQSVSFMTEGESSVTEGMIAMLKTDDGFNDIEQSTTAIVTASGSVLEAIKELDYNTELMVQSVASTAEIVEHSSAESQSIAAASEEQSASMEEVAASSAALSKMAEELSELVSEFRIK
ncbi:methyl-accepting chemotaxis protein [Jeotgalibacillus sp. R-1-5s-1]|uniref:methyl-accepting chemotaxis protein n=1 Tax=Jeotgalibacillus sp. R-1-5s-1 TaxID=2555897 RepID=UPI00106A663F|nr:methyl-accepting chemotaxis protein [Jeotgalibacillus sp. R-1-5s-1]TFD97097.1 methyl-accepting chemotaxis protein [Jeotgalibacillus sp. R-1-5s-1]